MIDTAEPLAALPPRSRRRRWRIVALVAAVVIVVGGVVTAVSIVDHYRDAPVLASDGGGWLPPDNAHARDVRAGPVDASIAAPRPGHPQTFEIEVLNPSSVTQTIVGLAFSNEGLAEPDHLAISAVDTAVGDPSRVRYTTGPVSIRPNGVRTLRYTHDTANDWAPCRAEYWTDLYLRVRVGWFTRTEKVSLNSLVIELQQPGRACR